MILNKSTNYSKSVSLTHEEFELAVKGEYVEVRVSSTTGKPLKTLSGRLFSHMVRKAKLLLKKDDPSSTHYWVVNI